MTSLDVEALRHALALRDSGRRRGGRLADAAARLDEIVSNASDYDVKRHVELAQQRD